jgi:flagellar basal-body rod protein FlgC
MSEGLFGAIKISASGLRGQRTKMDVVARNLANAETTRTEDGTPYRRQRAIFEQVLGDKVNRHSSGVGRPTDSRLSTTHRAHMSGLSGSAQEQSGGISSEVGVAPDASDFRVVYDPGHPDADNEGYLLLPNVNPVTEMVDMIAASRAYEANVSAVQTSKDMFNDALKI